jgi:hypothetical protein
MTVQTVYDVGDPITTRLKLGVVPDGTTNVTVTVTRPDGTAIAAPSISAWENVDEKTAQFYATDDGTLTGSSVGADGDWLVVWKVTGKGANVAAKVYSVAPLPGPSTRPGWSPFLSQVADHVPYLTVDTVTPGSQLYLGTFTGVTTPTDEVAQRHIDVAVSLMLPAILTISTALYPAARSVAALRAAASLARAFPRRPEDIAAAAALDARADASWKVLVEAAENEGTATSTVGTPHWSFPIPPTYGDMDL